MSFITWTPTALASEARFWTGASWRVVETQQVAATMRLVDTLTEQTVLEKLLEESKPPLPPECQDLHYLLATPFRYPPLPQGSRFRAATDPGVFYGAAALATAAAELSYWRWRFLRSASDLDHLEPMVHTAFRSELAALAIDLQRPPLAEDAAFWTHPDDYRSTQALAREAHAADIGIIRYRSVRDPDGGECHAVLHCGAFARPSMLAEQQNWVVGVRRDSVIWRREQRLADIALVFSAENW